MKLTSEQQLRIRESHGICVNEVCDKCGQVLAEVRFTIKDQPGEWCSRLCRGDVATNPGKCQHCNSVLPIGLRRGARYCDAACKKAAQRAKVRLAA
jgi:hypothetical protein